MKRPQWIALVLALLLLGVSLLGLFMVQSGQWQGWLVTGGSGLLCALSVAVLPKLGEEVS